MHVGTRTVVESGPGAVVGELAVLVPAPRSASVTAMESSLLLRLRRGAFDELLDDNPELARVVIPPSRSNYRPLPKRVWRRRVVTPVADSNRRIVLLAGKHSPSVSQRRG